MLLGGHSDSSIDKNNTITLTEAKCPPGLAKRALACWYSICVVAFAGSFVCILQRRFVRVVLDRPVRRQHLVHQLRRGQGAL
jgi:hypothetical protein